MKTVIVAASILIFGLAGIFVLNNIINPAPKIIKTTPTPTNTTHIPPTSTTVPTPAKPKATLIGSAVAATNPSNNWKTDTPPARLSKANALNVNPQSIRNNDTNPDSYFPTKRPTIKINTVKQTPTTKIHISTATPVPTLHPLLVKCREVLEPEFQSRCRPRDTIFKYETQEEYENYLSFVISGIEVRRIYAEKENEKSIRKATITALQAKTAAAVAAWKNTYRIVGGWCYQTRRNHILEKEGKHTPKAAARVQYFNYPAPYGRFQIRCRPDSTYSYEICESNLEPDKFEMWYEAFGKQYPQEGNDEKFGCEQKR